MAIHACIHKLLLPRESIVVDTQARRTRRGRRAFCAKVQHGLGTRIELETRSTRWLFDLGLGRGKSRLEVFLRPSDSGLRASVSCAYLELNSQIVQIAPVLVVRLSVAPDIRGLILKRIPGLEVCYTSRGVSPMLSQDFFLHAGQRYRVLDCLVVMCQLAVRQVAKVEKGRVATAVDG